MNHSEHAYFEAGYKCARARLRSDDKTAQHWQDWFYAALETEPDDSYPRRLFNQGYREAQPRGAAA